jgi:cytochrome P450
MEGQTHERSGHVLREGDTVFMTIMAANRDPRVFDQLDRLVWTARRTLISPSAWVTTSAWVRRCRPLR